LDYDAWRGNFGAPGAGTALGVAVPEPATVALVLGGLALVSCRRRARRKFVRE
jgi:hypothetical protein